MNGTKVAKPKYSKNVGEGIDTTAQAAGIIAGRYTVKMIQINSISRNQLHNKANNCQHLNFGLNWPR